MRRARKGGEGTPRRHGSRFNRRIRSAAASQATPLPKSLLAFRELMGVRFEALGRLHIPGLKEEKNGRGSVGSL
jgi:hypothetical protein